MSVPIDSYSKRTTWLSLCKPRARGGLLPAPAWVTLSPLQQPPPERATGPLGVCQLATLRSAGLSLNLASEQHLLLGLGCGDKGVSAQSPGSLPRAHSRPGTQEASRALFADGEQGA